MVLAFDDVPGTPLDAVGADVSDDLLRAIWEQVAIMRAHRIAHRDLRHTNVLVDATGTPWMVNFGFGEVGVSDAPLDTDVAELLCAIALIAGDRTRGAERDRRGRRRRDPRRAPPSAAQRAQQPTPAPRCATTRGS